MKKFVIKYPEIERNGQKVERTTLEFEKRKMHFM